MRVNRMESEKLRVGKQLEIPKKKKSREPRLPRLYAKVGI